MRKYIFILLSAFSLSFIACSNGDEKEDFSENNSSIKWGKTGNVNGHDYVDLGLSVSWATCNIGASDISDEGSVHFFGDGNGVLTFETAHLYNFPQPPIKGTIYDIATNKWGAKWSLPSFDEIEELENKCKLTKCKIGNVDGYRVLGPNGNSIFLPMVSVQYCFSVKPPYDFGVEKECVYMTSGDGFSYEKGRFTCVNLNEIGGNTMLEWSSYGECNQTVAVRPVTKQGATGNLSGGNGNSSEDNSGNGSSVSYEKPDIDYYDYTAYQTKMKVVYKIYNQDKAKVTSAKIYYGTSSNPTKTVTATVSGVYITATISGLAKDTKYYVKCSATGNGGTTTTSATRLGTIY